MQILDRNQGRALPRQACHQPREEGAPAGLAGRLVHRLHQLARLPLRCQGEEILQGRSFLGTQQVRCRGLLGRRSPGRFIAVRRKAQQAAGEQASGVEALAGAEIQHEGLVDGKTSAAGLGNGLLDQPALADPRFSAQHDHTPATVSPTGLQQAGQKAPVGLAADIGAGWPPGGLQPLDTPGDDRQRDTLETGRRQSDGPDPAFELTLQRFGDHHLAGAGEFPPAARQG